MTVEKFKTIYGKMTSKYDQHHLLGIGDVMKHWLAEEDTPPWQPTAKGRRLRLAPGTVGREHLSYQLSRQRALRQAVHPDRAFRDGRQGPRPGGGWLQQGSRLSGQPFASNRPQVQGTRHLHWQGAGDPGASRKTALEIATPNSYRND